MKIAGLHTPRLHKNFVNAKSDSLRPQLMHKKLSVHIKEDLHSCILRCLLCKLESTLKTVLILMESRLA